MQSLTFRHYVKRVSKWEVSFGSLCSNLLEFQGRGAEGLKESEKAKDTKTWNIESAKQFTYGLTETKLASLGLRGSVPGPLLTWFVELLTAGADMSLTLSTSLGTLFLLLSYLF